MDGRRRFFGAVAAVAVLLAVGAGCALSGGQTAAQVRSEGGKVWIEDVPPSGGEGNGYIRGLEMMLAHARTPVGYERLMGLSGMAFITQADTEHRWQGKVDVGWWPLAPWGWKLRREFLGRAVGRELGTVGGLAAEPDEESGKPADPERFYRDHIEPYVKRSINAGRPLMFSGCGGFVVTGYDDASGRPPLLGRGSRGTGHELARPQNWPLELLTLGRRLEPMDPDTADEAALRHAVALARDEGGPYEERWRGRRFTGQKAFAAWAALLRAMDEPTEDRHHVNMRLNLTWNRSAAVSYLREVASRRDGRAADELRRAAALYESVLAQLSRMDCRGVATDPEARHGLAEQVDRIATVERDAAQHMERAVMHMKTESQGQKSSVQGEQSTRSMTGHCHCGHVRYSAEGPILKQSYCRCRGCQRATGTLEAPFITVSREAFALTAGAPATFRAESGEGCDAHGQWAFCPRCGTQLFWDGDGRDRIDVFAGTLDDRSLFDARSE